VLPLNPCVTGCLALGRQLHPWSIKEGFLATASTLLGFGCLAMHNKSLGSLCHAT
jgi:hypothetical protein